MPLDFDFTTDWFTHNIGSWTALLEEINPRKILEIGSYEGRASCFLIEQVAAQRSIELHCVDTWEGSVEHDKSQMTAVEARFDANIAAATAAAAHEVHLKKHKGASSKVLPRMLTNRGPEYFDWIYVDGSHEAPDVLADAVMAFLLLKPGGLLVFDDYLWAVPDEPVTDFYQLPKPAIDAFVNINQRKLDIVIAPLYQLYVRKLSS